MSETIHSAQRPATLPALTGLRGVAALWVVLSHLSVNQFWPAIRAGYLGVDLFFILSGFVLSLVYAESGCLYEPSRYGRFLLIRLARIYPLHALVLALVVLMVVVIPGFRDAYFVSGSDHLGSALVASLLLVQDWPFVHMDFWNLPAWSLSAEWMGYLLFPLFLTLTQWPRGRASPVWLAILVLLATYGLVRLAGHLTLDAIWLAGTRRMLGEITAGCLLFRAIRNGLPDLGDAVDWLALFLVVCGAEFSLVQVLVLPGFALIILRGAQQRGMMAAMLSRPSLVFLGEISYSLYMFHWAVLKLLRFCWGIGDSSPLGLSIFWSVGFVLIAIVIAAASYRWIERPARAFGRSLVARPAAVSVLP